MALTTQPNGTTSWPKFTSGYREPLLKAGQRLRLCAAAQTPATWRIASAMRQGNVQRNLEQSSSLKSSGHGLSLHLLFTVDVSELPAETTTEIGDPSEGSRTPG